MSRPGRRLAAGWPGWAVAVACLSAGQAFAQPGKHLDPLSWDRNVQKLFRTHCYDCHDTEDASGGIDLAKDADPLLIRRNRDTWLGAVHVLTTGDMPPTDADPRPSDDERQLMIRFLEQTLTSLNCEVVDDPGPPPLRRLNRTEYDNSVADLLGLELGLAASFPPDPSSFGFDNIGPALSFSPVQLELYHAAARKAVAAVRATRLTAPETHARVFGGPDETDPASARPLIRRLAEQAFRRPLADGQLDRLVAIYEQSRATEDHETALGHVLTAVLISPHFLIRLEHNREAATEPYRIDGHELASRLSFFLWSRPPDEELLMLAAAGKLAKPEALAAQVRRMLADRRSGALVRNFFGQWLGLRGLADKQVDSDVFPEYDAALAGLLVAEVEAVLTEIVAQDRPLSHLIDADYTYLNDRLARHYDLPAVAGTELQRVSLSDRRRGGVLTSGALLMSQADPNRTNVPRRGNYIADRILGRAPPPPPPDVPALDTAAGGRTLTLRELLEKHRESATCGGCHGRIDPIGFSLENYDAIGRWRTLDAGQPIDPSGTLPDGHELDGPVALKDYLLGAREPFLRQFARMLLIYALGRGLEEADECVVRDLIAAAEADDLRFSAVVQAVVASRPFLYRRNPEF